MTYLSKRCTILISINMCTLYAYTYIYICAEIQTQFDIQHYKHIRILIHVLAVYIHINKQ